MYKIAFKLLCNLAVFIAMNWLIYIPLSIMYFRSYGGNSGAQINNVLRQTTDVFIFGSSRASHHYDPELIEEATGLTAFNAGDDGKNAVYQLGLLEMLLIHHKPKLILYEVGSLNSHMDGGDVDLFPYYFRDHQIKKLLTKRDPYASVKFFAPCYAYNGKVFNISLGYLFHTKPFKTGFRPLSGRMSSEEIKRNEDVVPHENCYSDLDPLTLSSFTEFTEICKMQGIKLIYVVSPTYIGNLPYGIKKIEEIAKNYNIQFINYASDLRFCRNPFLFVDSEHLNLDGAKQFTSDFVSRVFVDSIVTW